MMDRLQAALDKFLPDDVKFLGAQNGIKLGYKWTWRKDSTPHRKPLTPRKLQENVPVSSSSVESRACLFSYTRVRPAIWCSRTDLVDRHVVGPVSCFHLHQPVLLFTDHRFYRLSSSITWLKVPHVSDFIENVELAAIYRNIPCSLLVLHYYT